jgi:hypothetical protein
LFYTTSLPFNVSFIFYKKSHSIHNYICITYCLMPSQKVLIWAKTYPELSTRYTETVCTAGCTEDGKPIRLYPLPLRYLPEQGQYKLYSWVNANVEPSTADSRPESNKVLGSLRVGDTIETKKGSWEERRKIIFADTSWHYECLEDLKTLQIANGASLGFIKVGAIDRIWIKRRTLEEIADHWKKLEELKSQLHLFDPEVKRLEPQAFRVHIAWHCQRMHGDKPCPGHTAGVLDWGLGELGRRSGEEAAKQRMEELCRLDKYDLGFFVGNFKAHPRNFGIIGMWYPMHPKPELLAKPKLSPQLSLFDM